MAASTVWGLDIGNFSVKTVKMLKVGNVCKILDFDIVDIPGADDEKDRPSRLQTAFAELNKNHRFGNDPVCISVTGNICLSREFQLPAGSDDNPEKLNDLVQYEAKQQIPFPLDQVEWGYERYEDASGIGVVLIAVRKNEIQDLLALTDSFKMNVKVITTSPMALFNFINHEFKPDDTTLILDAGARGTDFVVMNKRQIYTRTIQIAGREITRVLENKFKVTFEKAEEIKKNISQSPQMEKILAVIEPTLRQLGVEVQRTIGFYKSKARGQRISKCYLLGHTFRLPKMAEYLQSQVREAPFAIVEGLQRIKLDESCDAAVWDREFPTLPVAIGLGLQGVELGELKLNLLPAERKSAGKNLRSRAGLVAAAALVLITLGVLYHQSRKTLGELAAQLDNLTALESSVTKYQKEEQRLAGPIPARKELLGRLVRVGHDRGKINRILSTVANLQTADNKPFFGPERKVYLVSLYESRVPPQDPLVDMSTSIINSSRRNDFEVSVFLHKPQGLYGPWMKTQTPALVTKPPELRPEPPFVVVATCEVSPPDKLLEVEREMETALKKLQDVNNDVSVEVGSGKPTYTDLPLMYDPDGKIKITATSGAAKPETHPESYATFHAIFRWDDQADKDIVADAPGAAAVKTEPPRR